MAIKQACIQADFWKATRALPFPAATACEGLLAKPQHEHLKPAGANTAPEQNLSDAWGTRKFCGRMLKHSCTKQFEWRWDKFSSGEILFCPGNILSGFSIIPDNVKLISTCQSLRKLVSRLKKNHLDDSWELSFFYFSDSCETQMPTSFHSCTLFKGKCF